MGSSSSGKAVAPGSFPNGGAPAAGWRNAVAHRTVTAEATAIVLAVLWAGAAAAESFAGAYRDVGPPVETYDGRVPAWITTARVSRVGTKRYSIRMSTGRSEPAGCTGEVTATGTLIGTAIMAAASDGSDCKLAITFERSTMRVREQGNCFTFRGMQCHFGGNLKRERSGG